MRLMFILSEIGGAIRRNKSMLVSVTLVAMISMFFLGAGLLAQREVSLAKGYWYGKVEVSVFMCTAGDTNVSSCADGAVTPAQRDQIRRDLDSMGPLVDKVYYESPQQAYDRFKQQMPNSPYLSQISASSMPSSYRIKLTDPNRYDDVVARLSGEPGVSAISDQRQVLSTFFKLLNVVSVGAVGLAVVMAICAVLLIATTVRQVAFSRRRQVEIMRLVGASAFVIYVPFVAEILLATLLGACLAVGVLYLMVRFGVTELFNNDRGTGDVIAIIGSSDLWRIAPWLVLGSAIVSIVVAWVSLRRQVRV